MVRLLRPTSTSDKSSQVGLIIVDKQSTLVKRQSNTTSDATADITTTSDASKIGWDASMGTLTTGGKWSQVEAQETSIFSNSKRNFLHSNRS